jgi:ethanolaminephosphotransferase
MVYVRQERLPGLKQYKYSGVDHSLTSKYILKPFYTNVVIKCFPMWMAPNLITLSGFMFVIINFITMLWYNPTLDQDCPRWVYFLQALGLFLYQTFDAVDGTQACVIPIPPSLGRAGWLTDSNRLQATNWPERSSR